MKLMCCLSFRMNRWSSCTTALNIYKDTKYWLRIQFFFFSFLFHHPWIMNGATDHRQCLVLMPGIDETKRPNLRRNEEEQRMKKLFRFYFVQPKTDYMLENDNFAVICHWCHHIAFWIEKFTKKIETKRGLKMR